VVSREAESVTGGQRPPTIGVLAIQGAVEKHLQALSSLGAATRRVLGCEDLERVDGLILPGGESTTISKGMARLGLYEGISAFAHKGRSILGTCAGAILLARESRNHAVRTLGLIDVRAVRNAYGTQVDSFIARPDEASDSAFQGMTTMQSRS
jgi:pyridoxal 5'-phosphate synthase pdxT subunit